MLKGNARARMSPSNLDHLRVEWRKQGTYETAWVTPGHDCLCPYKYGHGAAVRPQTSNAIWDVCKRECANGVNLNQYAGPGSHIRWHSDHESLFGQQYSPKLIVSLTLWSSRCVVARRVKFPLRFGWTMVTSWSWMV